MLWSITQPVVEPHRHTDTNKTTPYVYLQVQRGWAYPRLKATVRYARHSTLPALSLVWFLVCLWVFVGGGGAGTLIVEDRGRLLAPT